MISREMEFLRAFVEQGSESAFAELVRLRVSLVYFAALRQLGGDAHRAEDVTQVVFSTLASKAPSLIARTNLAGWLHTTTRYAAATARRADFVRKKYEEKAAVMPDENQPSSPDVQWERLRPLIDDVLQELDNRDREALLLRFFDDLSFADLAQTIGVSEDGARMRVNRALDRLHSRLSARGLTSATGALAAALSTQAGVQAPPALASAAIQTTAVHLAAATTPASGVFFTAFMCAAKSTSVAIAASTAVVLLGTAWLWREHRRIEVLQSDIMAQTRLSAELDGLRRAVAISQAELAQLKALEASLNAPRAAAPGVGSANPAATTAMPVLQEQEIMRLSRAAWQAEIEERYSDLFVMFTRDLGMPAVRVEQLKGLLIERRAGLTDLDELFKAQDIKPKDNPAAALALAREAVDLAEAPIREFLGPAFFDRYRDYERTLLERGAIEQLSRQLVHSPNALNRGQTEELIRVLAQHQTRPQTEYEQYLWLRHQRAVQLPKEVDPMFAQVLSPAQYTALKGLVDQSNEQSALNEMLQTKFSRSESL